MAVNINLKEVFSTDSQADLTGKLNFNFNQMLALGVGQIGLTGAAGAAGAPGPIGPRGLTGISGSKMWSTAGSTYIDLDTDSPANSVVGDYYVGLVTVDSVTYNGIYEKESEGTIWTVVTDFDEIFRDALSDSGGALFPWRIGVTSTTPPAKIIIPVNSAEGIDRINSSYSSAGDGYYLTYPPNWKLDAESVYNSQNSIFNFDTRTVKQIVTSASADGNGYYVKVSDDRLGAAEASLNTAFPYTSLLSLYSFYSSSQADVLADHITETTGYRHQLELGSVDEIIEYLHTSDSGAKYVISPTYQNLRVRKYRKAAADLSGKSVILADYNLHSSDGTTDPALNSKQEWTINKKTNRVTDNNAIISMALSSSTLEGSSANIGATGLAVDGIHFNLDSNNYSANFAIGFKPSNLDVSLTNALLITGDSSFYKVEIDSMVLQVTNGASISTTLTYNTLYSTGVTDLSIYPSDTSKELKLGSNGLGGYAISIKSNRLNSAIPFPVSTSTIPTNNSADVNTLDEYQEGSFTPTIDYSSDTYDFPTSVGPLFNKFTPTIADEVFTYVKIGKVVTFTASFSIDGLTFVTNENYTSGPPWYADPYNSTTVGANNGALLNNTPDEWTTDIHEIGYEHFQLKIRGLAGTFDHWPVAASENVKFSVNLTPVLGSGFLLRPFPLDYSYSVMVGETELAQASTGAYQTMDPNSLYARFTYWEDGIVEATYPQISLFGRRMHAVEGGDGYVKPGFQESNLTVYDFLNYTHPLTNGNKVIVTVSGQYITDHQTANTVHAPGGITTTTSTTTSSTTTTTTLGT